MTILFIVITTAFCVLLHYLLFYTDHHANKILIASLLTGVIAACVALVWLFNKFLSVTLQKRYPKGKPL